METRKRKVDTALLLEEYRTLLETVDQLPLLISGNSMSPFLVHGRDTVFLTRVKRPLRRGDIVLYRRQNGAYILHRICAVEGNAFTAVGDAQTETEKGIAMQQVIAVACAAERKGIRQAPTAWKTRRRSLRCGWFARMRRNRPCVLESGCIRDAACGTAQIVPPMQGAHST